jgi:hypothetical protein
LKNREADKTEAKAKTTPEGIVYVGELLSDENRNSKNVATRRRPSSVAYKSVLFSHAANSG